LVNTPFFIVSNQVVTYNTIEHLAHCQIYIRTPHNHSDSPSTDRGSLFVVCFSGSAAQCGLWPPLPWGFLITHSDAPQLVGLLWTSDQLISETSTW
jgi:hypothetical protein